MVRIEDVEDRSDDGFVTETSDDENEKNYYGEDEEDYGLDAEDEAALIAFNPQDETFAQRFSALQDMIPPQTRSKLCKFASGSASFFKSSTLFCGNVAWVVTTSAILVGLPLALAIESEGLILQQEKEFQRQQGQQEGGGTGIGGSPFGTLTPQSQQPQGVVPTGF